MNAGHSGTATQRPAPAAAPSAFQPSSRGVREAGRAGQAAHRPGATAGALPSTPGPGGAPATAVSPPSHCQALLPSLPRPGQCRLDADSTPSTTSPHPHPGGRPRAVAVHPTRPHCHGDGEALAGSGTPAAAWLSRLFHGTHGCRLPSRASRRSRIVNTRADCIAESVSKVSLTEHSFANKKA